MKEVEAPRTDHSFIDELHNIVGAGKAEGAMDRAIYPLMLARRNCAVLEQQH